MLWVQLNQFSTVPLGAQIMRLARYGNVMEQGPALEQIQKLGDNDDTEVRDVSPFVIKVQVQVEI